jgi:hypothetical protein
MAPPSSSWPCSARPSTPTVGLGCTPMKRGVGARTKCGHDAWGRPHALIRFVRARHLLPRSSRACAWGKCLAEAGRKGEWRHPPRHGRARHGHPRLRWGQVALQRRKRGVGARAKCGHDAWGAIARPRPPRKSEAPSSALFARLRVGEGSAAGANSFSPIMAPPYPSWPCSSRPSTPWTVGARLHSNEERRGCPRQVRA